MTSTATDTHAPLPTPVTSGERNCLALWGQDAGTVYVRAPGTFCYRQGDIQTLAAEYWPYAMLSLEVYSPPADGEPAAAAPAGAGPSAAEPPRAGAQAMVDLAARCRSIAAVPPFAGWQRWSGFPRARLDVPDDGLHLQVWEHAASRAVVVVFRGTDFASWQDWLSSLRWARLTRFLPGYADQYTRLARDFAHVFADELERRHPDMGVRLFAAGHSLGAGLAQHFAYSLPAATSRGTPLPDLAAVYAFNSSPVTGWMSVDDKEQRDRNVEGLQIYRIFEHGEGLAVPRRAISWLATPRAADPAIWEVRFNFSASLNIIGSHSMDRLACGLARAAYGPPASG